MDSTQLQSQLVNLAKNLQFAAYLIQPPTAEPNYAQRKKELYSNVLKNMVKEREAIIARKAEIELRKEKLEQEMQLKRQQEEEERRKKQAEAEQAELERQRAAAADRERIKKQREEEEKKRKEMESILVSSCS